MTADGSASLLAAIGRGIAPALAPLGFGFWQAAVALLSGLVAKETVVATFGILYGAGVSAIAGAFTPLSAMSFLVFVLLYVPCAATVTTAARELHSAKWAALAAFTQLAAAYIAALIVFQGGRLLGLG